jgi:A/G-specific adenine glycosylase
VLSEERIRSLRERLLAWYRAARRDLPWRRTRDPYRIWLSEVMLQQTRVEVAIPYYERFLARFPTLAALAAAREDDVLAAWAGLGYYARARNLHAAARECAARWGGAVPPDEAAFRALRGVGPYTAGAVLSIAYGRPLPAIDGNVVRVITRLERIEDDPGEPAARRRIEEAAAALVPPGAAGDWNQSLMELGALVCVPGEPRCTGCPIAPLCRAREAGVAALLPKRAKRRAPPEVEVAVALVVRRGALLLARRPARGILAAMWAPPSAEGGPGALEKAHALRPLGARPAGSWRHVFTHRVWNLSAFPCAGEPPAGARFVPFRELSAAGLPAAFQPAIALAAGAAGAR